jgi:hypothetical protein
MPSHSLNQLNSQHQASKNLSCQHPSQLPHLNLLRKQAVAQVARKAVQFFNLNFIKIKHLQIIAIFCWYSKIWIL